MAIRKIQTTQTSISGNSVFKDVIKSAVGKGKQEIQQDSGQSTH